MEEDPEVFVDWRRQTLHMVLFTPLHFITPVINHGGNKFCFEYATRDVIVKPHLDVDVPARVIRK